MRRLFILLVWIVASLPAHAEEPFFFIQASDVQFGYNARNQNLEQETANFEFLIATANRLRPAFLVVTGDLVNRARNPEQIAEYKRVAAKLDKTIPLRSVPGNHDVGDHPDARLLASWREQFGPDYFAFRVGGVAFLAVNSSLFESPKAPAGEVRKQLAWIRDELDKAKSDGAKRVVVFRHHPPSAESPDMELYRAGGVTHVFSGHLHKSATRTDRGIEIVVTGAIGMPRGGTQSGFRVVVVRDTGIGHNWHDMGAVPNRIELRPLP